jgi:hypothetical protein
LIREPIERIHEGRLLAIAAAHAAAAFVLVPLHYAAVSVCQYVWVVDDFDATATRLITLLVVGSVTHGVALAQLTIVALGLALLRWHWVVRVMLALFCWGLLLLDWTIVSLMRHPIPWRFSYSELTDYGLQSAMFASLGYLLLFAAFAWGGRYLQRITFTFAPSCEPLAAERWQLSISDLLLVTTACAALVSAGLWGGSWWTDAFDDLVQRQVANTILIVHAIVATPLIFVAAARAASGQRPSRWRMVWFVAVCVGETLFVPVWLAFHSTLALGGFGIFVICLVGTQLLVVVGSVRALVAAGGRLVRASPSNAT